MKNAQHETGTAAHAHRVVILGAGYAGMAAAVQLAARAKRRDDVDVTLVNAQERFTERMRLHMAATGQQLADLSIPELLAGTGARFVRGWVTAMDPDAKTVRIDDDQVLPYDTLVFGLGTTADTSAVPGVEEYAHTLSSAEDAEFLASQKLSNEDVARLFGVPPTSVGITDKATYSNTEQEARALVANCLGPLASRIEAAMLRCLLTEEGRRTLYIEHDLAALLKGDVQARFEAYRIGREIGVFSPNDIRRRENETPIPGGDVYHQPANWTPLGSTPEAA